jgi:16S rRNA (adenine1518-N6/adenine1519-N6)-dimethyltransferase
MNMMMKDPQRKKETRRRRHFLGQHFLVSPEICRRLVSAAGFSELDTVLEIGTGKGALTEVVAPRVRRVVTCEMDRSLFLESEKRLSSFTNVQLVCADAFRSRKIGQLKFDVCITSLPYSRSLDFIRWLSLRSGSFRCCIALIQSEFAEKIKASPGRRNYKSVSVLAQIAFKIEQLGLVERTCFTPPPNVQSTIVKFLPNINMIQPFFDRARLKLLTHVFSFRGRLLRNALISIQGNINNHHLLKEDLLTKRVEDVAPIEYANFLAKLGPKSEGEA